MPCATAQNRKEKINVTVNEFSLFVLAAVILIVGLSFPMHRFVLIG